MIYFISGHLDLTPDEFNEHYAPQINVALATHNCGFVLGDARGCDAMAQAHLKNRGVEAVVFHMFSSPRNTQAGFLTVGGFMSDEARDAAMTIASDADIAWVRPGREKSGTSKNLQRRSKGH